jgi:Na+-driven multidrug efflux pump
MNTGDIVKSAVNITTTVISVINGVPAIAAVGAGVMYTQAIARGDRAKANQIWKTTFYYAIGIGLFSSLIFFSLNDIILN